MSVIGNPIIIGDGIRKGPKILGWHKATSNSWTRVTDVAVYDSAYFSNLGNALYCCLIAGKYKFQLFSRGAFSSSGVSKLISVRLVLVRNDVTTVIQTLADSPNAGLITSAQSINLTVGDQIYCEMEEQTTSGLTTGEAGFVVYEG